MRFYRWLFTPVGDVLGCVLIAAVHFGAASLGDWQPTWVRLLLLFMGLYWIHIAFTNLRWYDRHLS